MVCHVSAIGFPSTEPLRLSSPCKTHRGSWAPLGGWGSWFLVVNKDVWWLQVVSWSSQLGLTVVHVFFRGFCVCLMVSDGFLGSILSSCICSWGNWLKQNTWVNMWHMWQKHSWRSGHSMGSWLKAIERLNIERAKMAWSHPNTIFGTIITWVNLGRPSLGHSCTKMDLGGKDRSERLWTSEISDGSCSEMDISNTEVSIVMEVAPWSLDDLLEHESTNGWWLGVPLFQESAIFPLVKHVLPAVLGVPSTWYHWLCSTPAHLGSLYMAPEGAEKEHGNDRKPLGFLLYFASVPISPIFINFPSVPIFINAANKKKKPGSAETVNCRFRQVGLQESSS